MLLWALDHLWHAHADAHALHAGHDDPPGDDPAHRHPRQRARGPRFAD